MSTRWNQEQDQFLIKLFEKGPQRGGIDYRDRSKENIEQVRQTHFPTRPIRSFAQLFCRKALAYETDKNLQGCCEVKPEAPPPAASPDSDSEETETESESEPEQEEELEPESESETEEVEGKFFLVSFLLF